MKELLELEYNQEIIIEKNTYIVKAMLKFVEGSSYWKEYVLEKKDTSERYYFDVEPIGKYALHKMINIYLAPDFKVVYENEEYELFQKGNAKIETYFGSTDVALKEGVEYYEYKCGQKILTIEKWKDETEISCGKYIEKNKIKIKKVKNDTLFL